MRTLYRQSNWRIVVGNREHEIPHFHVIFNDGSPCAIAITTLTVLAGRMLPKRVEAAIEWASAHKDLLMNTWEEMNP